MSTTSNRNRISGLMIAISALAVIGLSACSSGPELLIDKAPANAAVLNGVALVADASDPRASTALIKALGDGHGIRSGDDWQVVATLAVRPVAVGTYSDDDARDGEWAETPRARGARREPGLHVLTAVAVRKDGSDRRVARVSGRGPVDQTPDELLDALAELAARALVEGQTAPA